MNKRPYKVDYRPITDGQPETELSTAEFRTLLQAEAFMTRKRLLGNATDLELHTELNVQKEVLGV